MKQILFFILLSSSVYAQVNQRRGYTNHTEMGILLGRVAFNNQPAISKASFSALTFNGYRFIPALAVGLTLGVDAYRTQMIVPLSLGLRGDFLKNQKVTPFYALDVGKGMTGLIKNNTLSYKRGGLHLNPALGLRFATGGGSSLSWSVGYKRQLLSSGIENGYGEGLYYDYAYNRFSMRMGMSF